MAKIGRPSLYTPKLAKEICERLKSGAPLTRICSDAHMPDDETVRQWAKKNAALSLDIAHAREIGFDTIAANTRLVAAGVEGHSSGDVQRDKLIVDTDLKLLAKWDPKRYGEKVTTELTGADGKDLHFSDNDLSAKLAAILEAASKRRDGA
jgi:hypothetical protein